MIIFFCPAGETIDCDPSDLEGGGGSGSDARRYHLRGMVVHSGQASGGHYYSYIHCGADRGWFKFDDGDVTEAKMEEDDELKAQCYGGEYMSEVFDPMLKRMSYRKQKRWWNAYMLFYTRADLVDSGAGGVGVGVGVGIGAGGGDGATSPSSSASAVAAQLARLRVLDEKQPKKSASTLAATTAATAAATAPPPGRLKVPHPIEKSIQKQVGLIYFRTPTYLCKIGAKFPF